MRFSTSAVFSLLAVASALLAAPTVDNHHDQRIRDRRGLHDYAKKAGLLYFGSAADIPGTGEDTDLPYQAILNDTHEFGQITPTNYMKYGATEPQRNIFNFTGGDVLAGWARANNQLLRCHTLLWHTSLPSWLETGTWDNKTLISIMENHITKLIRQWGTQCYAWDVVNEAFNEDGTFRETIWYKTIGEAYIPLAFNFATKAVDSLFIPGVHKTNSPSSKPLLYYNDYNIERYNMPKSLSVGRLIRDVRSFGARIDGVGIQCHQIVGRTPTRESQRMNMQYFIDLGVDVAITELDARHQNVSAIDAAARQQQRLDYESTVGACVDVATNGKGRRKGCIGITLWDFTDKYSWVESGFGGLQGQACPWDANLKKKEWAYGGILDGLRKDRL
ncbi:glycoside hydrolase family 10 protein [Cadophora sp. DSE1049]|nr:glycoside hydrolase family 10 protein [Cadophora sp. DSE1049]